MSQARVEDIDAVKRSKLALQKFQEAANVALSEAESDLIRTMLWIDTEQSTYWQGQVRKRTGLLSQAEERLRMKKLFKDSTGSKPSTIDEEKAVKVAKQRLEEAHQKVIMVSKWKRQMEKVAHDYKGSVQRFATTVQSSLPNTIAKLEAMTRQLEQYLGLNPAQAVSTAGGIQGEPTRPAAADEGQSMRRAEAEEPGPAESEGAVRPSTGD
ncbi:MAG TPA: hypothetical protein PLD59_01930 [Tepidisphaeraceae bacterium]|nr:hypothetical protein [Tepidisphaeraceae bacterium]